MSKGTCSVDGCSSDGLSKGLCKLHYQRQWRTGSVNVSRPCLHGTTEERFWNYLTKKGEDECWEWQGFRDKDGYGKLRTKDTNEAAHRVSYRMHNGSIAKELMVLHKCNNPPCCNPKHLYQGDQTRNMADRTECGNSPVGESHANCKFTEDIVEAVRMAKGTYDEIGQTYNMSRSQVGNIKHGRQRTVKATKKLPHQYKDKTTIIRVIKPNTWGHKVAESQRKISPETAEIIKTRIANGELVKDLAVEYGIHRTSLSKIKLGTYFTFGQKR